MFLELRSGTCNILVILVIQRSMTYIALKVARFSSKKESSMVKNLNRTSKKERILKYRSRKLKNPLTLHIIENYRIKFNLTDDVWNFADADLVSPASSKMARSSSLIASFPNSSRLVSE